MRRSLLLALGAVGAALPLLAAQAPARHGAALQLRPNPQTTAIAGSNASGAILLVSNSASAPFNAWALLGAVTGGPYGIGLLGYGGNAASGNLATVGYDIGPGGVGVTGESTYTTSAAPTSSTQATGVLGISAYGPGVSGQTSRASTTQPGQAGVVGTDTTSDSGYNVGVLGVTANGVAGVEGTSGDGAMASVEAIATDGIGVYASSGTGYGVDALSLLGPAFYGQGSSSLYALYAYNAGSGDGILGVSNSGPGVAGSAFGTSGVFGTSAGGLGVQGVSTATMSTFSDGVSGVQNSYDSGSCGDQCLGGNGVYGSTQASSSGTSPSAGVYGYAHNAVLGYPEDSLGYSFVGLNASGSIIYDVDATGTVHTLGAFQTLGGTRSTLRTSHGYYASAYGAEALSRTLEDENTGAIVNGSGVVHIDPAFTEAVGGAPYQVFLTPDGDSNGLYVSAKSPTSFVVRESHGGRSSIAFDYRILAHPYGHASERMAVVSSLAGLSGGDAILGTGGQNSHAVMEARLAAARRMALAQAARVKAQPLPARALASARHLPARTLDFNSFLPH